MTVIDPADPVRSSEIESTDDDALDTRADPPGDDDDANDVDQPVDTDELAGLVDKKPIPRGYARLQDEAEATIRRDGLTQFYGLRRMWSGWLIGWVSVLICFQIVLTFAIGLGALDYSRYDWFLPLVTAQKFLQIVGMAIVVVRFLHSNGSKPPDRGGY